jgi:hypothetical protein
MIESGWVLSDAVLIASVITEGLNELDGPIEPDPDASDPSGFIFAG